MGVSGSKKKAHVLFVGLDNSGKTTIINKLKPPKEQDKNIVPTIGFRVDQFSTSSIQFTVSDMAGQGKYRKLWEHHFKDTNCVVLVVDSSDKIRLVLVKEELDIFLQHPDAKDRNTPILVFSNKMDIPDGMSALEVSQKLELDQIRNKPWHICATNALSGEGLKEGIDWLSTQLKHVV